VARKASGGIMITASHNPVPDNGIKFFAGDGYKINSEIEASIEGAINKGAPGSDNPTFGTLTYLDARPGYLVYLQKIVRRSGNGHNIRIVLDCAYGATSELAPQAMEQAGFEIDVINGTFDGSRINVKCGATHLDALAARVKKNGADMGLAYDGDGDRVLAVDHLGRPVSGDKIIALLALRLRSYRKQGAVVMTQMTNLGVEEALEREGVRMHRTEVGDIQVLAGMRREGLNLGGEQSGHVIMSDVATSGDGILTGLRLADVVRRLHKPLAELVASFPEYPQMLTNLELRDKAAWKKDKPLAGKLNRIHKLFPDVRFYLRPSGTENLMRILTESRSSQRCREGNEAVVRALKEWNGG
jgi:phosphoglucosamine mutase